MDEHKKDEKKENGEKTIGQIVKDSPYGKHIVILISIVAVLLVFNQIQIFGITGNFGGSVVRVSASEVYEIKSTSQAVASLFPVEEIQTEEDAIAMMITQGTPDYGDAMGVSFDDPVGGLELLAKAYPSVKQDVQQNYPEIWKRYLNLATKPVGISCEFCCGVGPIGITNSGDLKCGCKHNPAVQALTMLLMKDTNYDDAQILTEIIKWKSVFYPKDMVGLAMKASGGEIDAGNLPGMVGGC